MFRINFNGQQVSRTFDTYKEAKAEYLSLAAYSARIGQAPGNMWIQKYEGDGEWFSAKYFGKDPRPVADW